MSSEASKDETVYGRAARRGSVLNMTEAAVANVNSGRIKVDPSTTYRIGGLFPPNSTYELEHTKKLIEGSQQQQQQRSAPPPKAFGASPDAPAAAYQNSRSVPYDGSAPSLPTRGQGVAQRQQFLLQQRAMQRDLAQKNAMSRQSQQKQQESEPPSLNLPSSPPKPMSSPPPLSSSFASAKSARSEAQHPEPHQRMVVGSSPPVHMPAERNPNLQQRQPPPQMQMQPQQQQRQQHSDPSSSSAATPAAQTSLSHLPPSSFPTVQRSSNFPPQSSLPPARPPNEGSGRTRVKADEEEEQEQYADYVENSYDFARPAQSSTTPPRRPQAVHSNNSSRPFDGSGAGASRATTGALQRSTPENFRMHGDAHVSMTFAPLLQPGVTAEGGDGDGDDEDNALGWTREQFETYQLYVRQQEALRSRQAVVAQQQRALEEEMFQLQMQMQSSGGRRPPAGAQRQEMRGGRGIEEAEEESLPSRGYDVTTYSNQQRFASSQAQLQSTSMPTSTPPSLAFRGVTASADDVRFARERWTQEVARWNPPPSRGDAAGAERGGERYEDYYVDETEDGDHKDKVEEDFYYYYTDFENDQAGRLGPSNPARFAPHIDGSSPFQQRLVEGDGIRRRQFDELERSSDSQQSAQDAAEQLREEGIRYTRARQEAALARREQASVASPVLKEARERWEEAVKRVPGGGGGGGGDFRAKQEGVKIEQQQQQPPPPPPPPPPTTVLKSTMHQEQELQDKGDDSSTENDGAAGTSLTSHTEGGEEVKEQAANAADDSADADDYDDNVDEDFGDDVRFQEVEPDAASSSPPRTSTAAQFREVASRFADADEAVSPATSNDPAHAAATIRRLKSLIAAQSLAHRSLQDELSAMSDQVRAYDEVDRRRRGSEMALSSLNEHRRLLEVREAGVKAQLEESRANAAMVAEGIAENRRQQQLVKAVMESHKTFTSAYEMRVAELEAENGELHGFLKALLNDPTEGMMHAVLGFYRARYYAGPEGAFSGATPSKELKIDSSEAASSQQEHNAYSNQQEQQQERHQQQEQEQNAGVSAGGPDYNDDEVANNLSRNNANTSTESGDNSSSGRLSPRYLAGTSATTSKQRALNTPSPQDSRRDLWFKGGLVAGGGSVTLLPTRNDDDVIAEFQKQQQLLQQKQQQQQQQQQQPRQQQQQQQQTKLQAERATHSNSATPVPSFVGSPEDIATRTRTYSRHGANAAFHSHVPGVRIGGHVAVAKAEAVAKERFLQQQQEQQRGKEQSPPKVGGSRTITWFMANDPNTGLDYWYTPESNFTTWNKPKGRQVGALIYQEVGGR